MTEPTISIPYGDWLQEYRKKEISLRNDEEICDAAIEGATTAEIARMSIVAREQKHAPEDLLPMNKLLLLAGGRDAISAKISQRRIEFETKSGKRYEARALVADVPAEGEEEDVERVPMRYVAADSAGALERAERYLLERVPGYIFGRLKIIALNEGDAAEMGEMLKARIDELVSRLE